MNLTDFMDRIPTADDGRAIVTLMHDPKMTDATGSPVGFLSLVDRGANGRRIGVRKAEQLINPNAPTWAAQGETGSGIGPWDWVRSMFGSLLGMSTVTKALNGDPPVTFDAAVAWPKMRDGLWTAQDGLYDVIHNILASPEVDDKGAAIRAALGQFEVFVMGLMETVAKAAPGQRAQLATVVKAAGRTALMRQGVISGQDPTMINDVQATMAELERTLAAKAATTSEQDMMTPEQIQAMAIKAGEAAIVVAKSAGIIDPTQLQQIGVAAVQETVVKMVTAPKQPGQTPMALAAQLAMADATRRTPAPEAGFDSVLGRLGTLTMKVDDPTSGLAVQVAKLSATVHGTATVGDVKGEPSMREVIAKTMDVVVKLEEKVSKALGIPAAPKSGAAAAPEDAAVIAAKAVLAAKAANTTSWAGSAFDLNDPQGGAAPGTTTAEANY